MCGGGAGGEVNVNRLCTDTQTHIHARNAPTHPHTLLLPLCSRYLIVFCVMQLPCLHFRRSLRRLPWLAHSVSPSLDAALRAFTLFMHSYTQLVDENSKNVRNSSGSIYKLKSSLKASIKQKEKQAADIERVYKRAVDERDRAVADEQRAQAALQALHARREQAKQDEANGGSGAKKKGLFSSLLGDSDSADSLKTKEASAAKEWEKMKQATAAKAKELVKAGELRTEEMNKLLNEVQQMDVDKVTRLSGRN